jgi:hypothetical protein
MIPAPYFGMLRGAPAVDAPRLLVISYHFPPSTAVGGVRWQELARFAVDRGWAVDVIMRDPAALDRRDDSRMDRLPAGIRLFAAPEPALSLQGATTRVWGLVRRHVPSKRARTIEAVGRAQIDTQQAGRRFVRAYFAALDFADGSAWARSAARVGRQLAQTTMYSAIVSSGPPHMAHEAARSVATRAGVPLIVDFRDPWSLQERVPEHIASPLWFRLAERFERRVVAAASVVVLNTDPSRDGMLARYPALADRLVTVRNGSDEDPLPAARPTSRFSIRFAGSIYLDRDPRLVFRAAARVIRELRLTADVFGFSFMGNVASFGGLSLQAIAQQEGIEAFVEAMPPKSREEAMAFLAAGAMLLSLPQDSDMAIPAKIFEYVRFPAWLLILAVPASAAARMLAGSDADVVDPHDVDAMAAVIRGRYEQFARGERPAPVGRDGRFARRTQAELLFARIEELIASKRPGS